MTTTTNSNFAHASFVKFKLDFSLVQEMSKEKLSTSTSRFTKAVVNVNFRDDLIN